MQRGTLWTVAATGTVLTALLSGCSSGGDDDQSAGGAVVSSAATSGSGSSSPAAGTPTGPPPAPGAVVFSDEMDDDRNGWGTGPGLAFTGGEYVEKATVPAGLAGWPDAMVRTTPESVVVTARMSAPSGSAVLAVTCNNVPDGQGGGEFYALGISGDATFISRTSSYDEVPLRGDLLAQTDSGVDLTVPHDLQGSCVLAGDEMDLWLSVDGQPVLSAVDDEPLGAGPPGLQMVGADADGTSFEAHAASFSVATPA